MTATKSIPIENIYYLLAYAWDYFQEGELRHVQSLAFPNANNLLGFLLANGIRNLARRGMDKNYFANIDAVSRLRGKILIVESYQRMTHRTGQMICDFDEMSADTLPNRLLRSTCDRLVGSRDLTTEVRRSIRGAQKLLSDISTIRITRRAFHDAKLHRNNRHYWTYPRLVGALKRV